MAKKFSKLYKATDTDRRFRYNYERCELEWVTLSSFMENGPEKLDEPELVDSIGLGLENWKEDPQYWVDAYDDEIAEEIYCLMDEL